MPPSTPIARQVAPIAVALAVMAFLAFVVFDETLGEFLAALVIVIPGSLLGVLLGRRRREERPTVRDPEPGQSARR